MAKLSSGKQLQQCFHGNLLTIVCFLFALFWCGVAMAMIFMYSHFLHRRPPDGYYVQQGETCVCAYVCVRMCVCELGLRYGVKVR